MKWDELSTDEKNTLVAEKIFNLQAEECEDIHGLRQEISVMCGQCGYVFSDITSHSEYGPDAYPMQSRHNKPIPSYSTSLDRAWEVVRKLNDNDMLDKYFEFTENIKQIVGSDMFFDLFYCDPQDKQKDHLTPDIICIAALRACGVEIEE